MNLIVQIVIQHWAAASATISVLVVAAVCTMPAEPPGVLKYIFSQETWTWLRDTLQTAIPAARHSQNPTNPNPKE